MSRLKCFTYCLMSFVAGMLVLFATWQAGVVYGSIIRGAEVVADEQAFWIAMAEKVPFERNGYKFLPHTHEKQIRVVKRR